MYSKNTQDYIIEICDNIKNILLDKNRKYGDSALNPLRIFSKLDTKQQIFVRLDDKLSRLKNQQVDDDEDAITDLIGYLLLLKVSQMKEKDAIIK